MYKFSEYVSPGHPDKCADYICEYILDRYIEKDPNVKYAVEVMIKGNAVYLGGEVTSTVSFTGEDYAIFVSDALKEIGYTEEYYKEWGEGNVINPDSLLVVHNITEQSPEIGLGVSKSGWGDQGIFFGYADCDGDKYMMPRSHSLAKNLCHMLYTQAKEKGIGGIDIKTEIIENDGGVVKIIAAVPCRSEDEYYMIDSSIWEWCKCNCEEIYHENGYEYMMSGVDIPKIILNGTGSYVMHGPVADCGVTGRKLAVDFYGGEFRVGGGSPIKDGTKADVTLNLYARKMALDYAKKCNESVMVSLACCIGRSEVDYSVSNPCGDEIESGVIELRPSDLIMSLGLDKPIFTSMNTFGLFGEFQQDKNWEK